jgi:hypothetical protein
MLNEQFKIIVILIAGFDINYTWWPWGVLLLIWIKLWLQQSNKSRSKKSRNTGQGISSTRRLTCL